MGSVWHRRPERSQLVEPGTATAPNALAPSDSPDPPDGPIGSARAWTSRAEPTDRPAAEAVQPE